MNLGPHMMELATALVAERRLEAARSRRWRIGTPGGVSARGTPGGTGRRTPRVEAGLAGAHGVVGGDRCA